MGLLHFYDLLRRIFSFVTATLSTRWNTEECIEYPCQRRHRRFLPPFAKKVGTKKINKNSFYVCEGFDQTVDRPYDLEKKYPISFIGNIYGNRKQMIDSIDKEVHIFNNLFGKQHAECVSETFINLNFCTDSGASDRIYKIMED